MIFLFAEMFTVFGSFQTGLPCIMWELGGEGSVAVAVAVGVSDM